MKNDDVSFLRRPPISYTCACFCRCARRKASCCRSERSSLQSNTQDTIRKASQVRFRVGLRIPWHKINYIAVHRQIRTFLDSAQSLHGWRYAKFNEVLKILMMVTLFPLQFSDQLLFFGIWAHNAVMQLKKTLINHAYAYTALDPCV